MKRFLLFCSGANIEVLKACPTDESKYVGIGATILLTAILASLSGGYALFTVFQSVTAAAAFGGLWGVVIFNLDRVIVSGMRKQRHLLLDVLYAAPRLVIAVLLAVVISRPLELKLFDKELRIQWAQMQIDARNHDVERIRAGDGARLAELRAENERLNEEVEAKRGERDAANDSLIQEIVGLSGTRTPGDGRVAREKRVALNEAERQMQEVETRNLPLIRQNEEEIRRLELSQNQLIAQTDDVRKESLGFLARMEAFGALKKESRSVHLASLFITLLFISLETAPVIVKLLSTLSPFRPYDELLEQREFEVVEAARQQVRVRRHELKAEADRQISEHTDKIDTEIQLSTEREQLRRNAELNANETLFEKIAEAQTELAERLVDEWKRQELEKIEDDLGAYVNNP